MICRKFFIGSEWIYYKIYSGPKTIEGILISLYPKIRSFIEEGKVDFFFFIRYSDPEYHIRLRMHISSSESLQPILLEINKFLNNLVENHIISNVMIGTYNREIERYGEETIEATEYFFYKDSEYILSYLEKKDDRGYDRWKISLKFMDTIMNVCGFSIDDKIQFAKGNKDAFYKELFGEDKDASKVLNSKYRSLKNEIQNIMNEEGLPLFIEMKKYVHSFMQKKKNDSLYYSSIIHMHINRMFRTRQRQIELVLYHLLYKHLLSEKGRMLYSSL